MTALEAFEMLAKIPEDQRTGAQARVFTFLNTIQQNKNSVAWAKCKNLPIPTEIAKDLENSA